MSVPKEGAKTRTAKHAVCQHYIKVAVRVQSTSNAEQNNLNAISGKGIPVAQTAVKLLRL